MELTYLCTRNVGDDPESLAHFISAPHLSGLKVLSVLGESHQASLYEALAEATHLGGLNHLSLSRGYTLQGFEAVPEMLRAPHFANLTSLIIPIDPAGLATLRDATHLDKLRHLRLELRNCRTEDADALIAADHLNSVEFLGLSGGIPIGFVGRLLRTSSLDELPQLLNVIRGDMSLVGPRPERPVFVERFTHEIQGYGDRHRVPVGLTGWALIHRLRGDTSIEERARFDNYYIENWSFWLDLRIMAATVPVLLQRPRRRRRARQRAQGTGQRTPSRAEGSAVTTH